ncbi:MAG: molybdenum cofactor biosynthesis protein MoaE [Candidatus Omnitrophota bacterium]
MFILQENPIDLTKARSSSLNPNNGALVSFEGIVRNDEHQNTKVTALLYIADAPLCLEEGNKIVKEALSRFNINDIICIQRTGKLNVGETAIWIGVWAPHRDEAFKACRYMIEEVKERLHIWKKEFLNDGLSLWAYGTQSPVIQ